MVDIFMEVERQQHGGSEPSGTFVSISHIGWKRVMHVIDFKQALLMRCYIRNENREIQYGTFVCTKSGTNTYEL